METTTDKFQVLPDFYMSSDECKNLKFVNTNSRYSYFKQIHFTAGDEDQFESYRNATNGEICPEKIDLAENRFSEMPAPENIYWEKYRDINSSDVDNTFKYFFHKMKKALFVQIRDNKVKVYLPFSNARYTNDWGHLMKVDPSKYQRMEDFFRHSSILGGRPFNSKLVATNPSLWVGNNCLLRTEYPSREGDGSMTVFSDMFRELCRNRQVPDCEFFVNKRDFPLLKNNGTEAYDAIFGEDTPLLDHNYKKYAPLLGMVTTDKNADIPIPTWEDWMRVSSIEDRKFFNNGRDYKINFDIPWANKKAIAVFRGGSTGCGTEIETNPRIKLARMNLDNVLDEDGQRLLDAGITDWNTRPRKEPGKEYLTTIELNELNIPVIDSLNPYQQSGYKYIINVDGHVSAYRLSLELSTGSVILLADSKYHMWYHQFLQPWVHYVPVTSDLSDLYEKIKWCKTHDEECQTIAQNALEFYGKYLSKEGIFDYLQNLLVKLKEANGIYYYSTTKPQEVISELETNFFNDRKKFSEEFQNPSEILYKNRCYGFYRGIETYFDLARSHNKDLDELLEKIGEQKDIGTTSIIPVQFNGVRMIEKKVENLQTAIHEAFIGCSSMNEMMKYIPNFMYTFGLKISGENVSILTEEIGGVNFVDYLRSERFNFEDYLLILIQLGLALRFAQDRCGFVHSDLYPWNIILMEFDEPVIVEYPITYNKVYKVKTKTIPVIIDYGRSQAVHDNIYYNIFEVSPSSFHDILSIFISSLYEILNRQLEKYQLGMVFDLANFISGTDFRPMKFTNVKELKEWLSHNKKFSIMSYTFKGDLANRDVLSFVDFLHTRKREKVLEIVSVFNSRMIEINERIIFDLLNRGEKSSEDVIREYLENIEKCDIPEKLNTFMKYQIMQNYDFYLTGVSNILPFYRDEFDIDQTMKLIERVYTTMDGRVLQNMDELKEIGYVKSSYPMSPSNVPYSFNNFNSPEILIQVSYRISYYMVPDYARYYNIILNTFLYQGRYNLGGESRVFYLKNFLNILGINPFAFVLDRAYRHTFKILAENVIDNNIQSFEKDKCDSARKFVDICQTVKKVLKKIK